MLLARQIKVESKRTGRRPKAVCNGTLICVNLFHSCAGVQTLGYSPEEVAETKDENRDAGKLDSAG